MEVDTNLSEDWLLLFGKALFCNIFILKYYANHTAVLLPSGKAKILLYLSTAKLILLYHCHLSGLILKYTYKYFYYM